MGAVQGYRFSCPGCGETIFLDEGMRELLRESGCIVCGAAVDESDFVATPQGV